MYEERRFARASAMRLLYSWSMGDEEQLTTLGTLYEDAGLTLDDRQRAYIGRVVDGVKERLPEIDAVVDRLAAGWSAERLPRVDLAILRLGVYELGWCDDIPDGATIDECVELAKQYSVPQSGTYINGILSSWKKEKDKAPDIPSAGEE